ncbi:hypothetical protein KKG51_02380, partial [Patescibacteria group bacterium]|nr:hypothetical protein [Patescibacteria group bacterium]
IGENSEIHIVHASDSTSNTTVIVPPNTPWYVEVFEGTIDSNTGESVSEGEGKVEFDGNPNGVVCSLAGTDAKFGTGTTYFSEEPKPEFAEVADVVEPEPEVIEEAETTDEGVAEVLDTAEQEQDVVEEVVEDIQAEDTQAEPEPDVVEPKPDVMGGDESGSQDVISVKDTQAEVYVPESKNGGGGGCSVTINNKSELIWYQTMTLLFGAGIALGMLRRKRRREQASERAGK